MKISYSRKNQTGGVEDMEFPGVLKTFLGSIKKEVKFPGVLKKNSSGISMGLGFWSWNFQGVSHNFAEIPWAKVCFLLNF